MKIGLSTGAFYGRLETDDAAVHIKELPVDFCEVFLETPSEYKPAFGSALRNRLGDFPCSSIHVQSPQYEPDLFGASPRQRRDAMASFASALDCGEALGASIYVFHGPQCLVKHRPPWMLRNIDETLPALVKMAEERGIRFCWENVSYCSARIPEDVAYLRRSFPGLGFVLDIKQAHNGGEDPFLLLDAMGESLCHVHVLDVDMEGRFCLPGQGVFPFEQLRSTLCDNGYEGGILLEPYSAQSADSKALATSLAYLHDVFA